MFMFFCSFSRCSVFGIVSVCFCRILFYFILFAFCSLFWYGVKAFYVCLFHIFLHAQYYACYFFSVSKETEKWKEQQRQQQQKQPLFSRQWKKLPGQTIIIYFPRTMLYSVRVLEFQNLFLFAAAAQKKMWAVKITKTHSEFVGWYVFFYHCPYMRKGPKCIWTMFALFISRFSR